MEAVFYISAFLSVYSYFVYPLILLIVPARRRLIDRSVSNDGPVRLSLIITAHNEGERLADKLRNSLDIDYPKDFLEIIVASDCSTDTTDRIAASFADSGIRLVRVDERRGKEYAQQCAIQQSRGDILVFSDVATQIPKDALQKLLLAFADQNIGAVSSEDRFISINDRVAGEEAYVKYEMWLRRLESDRAGLVGLSGSFFAARREVCEHWDASIDSDFNVARNCVRLGLVATSAPDVLGYYRDIRDPKQEYHRKVRTVIRGITAISRHSWVLNPFRMGLFAFEVWSHKILRWSVPWFMLVFAATTILMLGQGAIYSLALAAQIVLYTIALTGWVFGQLRQNMLVRIVFFFVQTNLALAHATIAFFLGKRITVWTPSLR